MSAADESPTLEGVLHEAEAPAHGPAPHLPIQAPAVRAALALERLKGQCDLALFHLEHQPDQPEPINAALNGAVGQINAAIAAVQHLQELRSCKGQG